MAKKKAFTLIEVLTVLAIVALLMATLMPALRRARKQGKDVVCRWNLRQWGAIFHLYMDDNNGLFILGASSAQWRWAIERYRYKKLSTTCPEAMDPQHPDGARRAWGNEGLVWQGDYGSYGINRWLYNQPYPLAQSPEAYWKTRDVKHSYKIPMFLDCSSWGGEPTQRDEPPRFDGDINNTYRNNSMRRFCINRHHGSINGVMLDGHVRSIGLKQLWTLKWNRKFIEHGPWTKAGGVNPEDWPRWIRNFGD